MNDSKKYFHPESVRRISRLEIRSRHIVEGFFSGMHRSPFFGQSVEFRQHREYSAGDDLRHVDWAVWARQDRLYVKQFEEDTNLICQLVVDSSESMNYGDVMSKRDYAATLACCVAFLLNRQKDSVGLCDFGGPSLPPLSESNRGSQLARIAAHLSSLAAEGQTPDSSPPTRSLSETSAVFRHRGLVIVFSDFLDDLNSIKDGLRQLRQHGHDVIVIQILHDDEIDFPFHRPTQFMGLESETRLRCHPTAIRDTFVELMKEHLSAVRLVARQLGCDFEMIRTSTPFDVSLTQLLNRRLQSDRTRR